MDQNRIIALVPAWNEGLRIRPVLEATHSYLPLLVVDDGSVDDTAQIAEAVGATVVRHAQNQGKGVALMTGFRWALERGYDAILTLDADGQHDPADIPKFLAAYQAGEGDLIIGKRDFRQMPFPRCYTNPFGSWLLSRVLGAPILDNQSGYRLYGRRVLDTFQPTATGFELEVEVIVHAVNLGISIGWVDIRTIYGIGKVSYFHPIRDSLRFLQMVWWARRQRAGVSDTIEAEGAEG
jgi:glycosyltransferase involved in cell wall biosynthesis